MCYSVSLSPSLHLSKKPVPLQLHVPFQRNDSWPDYNWCLSALEFFFFFYFNGIQLTALMGPLPKSCGQEAISHLMAINNNYEQNTLKEYVRASCWTQSCELAVDVTSRFPVQSSYTRRKRNALLLVSVLECMQRSTCESPPGAGSHPGYSRT